MYTIGPVVDAQFTKAIWYHNVFCGYITQLWDSPNEEHWMFKPNKNCSSNEHLYGTLKDILYTLNKNHNRLTPDYTELLLDA